MNHLSAFLLRIIASAALSAYGDGQGDWRTCRALQLAADDCEAP